MPGLIPISQSERWRDRRETSAEPGRLSGFRRRSGIESETSSNFGPQTLSAGPQSISLSDIAGAVYGPEGYAGPFSGPDVVGDRSGPQDSFDSRFGDWGQQPYAGPLPILSRAIEARPAPTLDHLPVPMS